MKFFYSIVMLLHDFVGAYIEDPYNIKGFFNVIKTILTDIKFWLVFCIITVIGIIPLGVLLTQHEIIQNSKIDAHVILHDGREFHLKKSEIYQHGDVIEFKVNGEEIETTLYTITYKHNN
jgi:hypothetical protein